MYKFYLCSHLFEIYKLYTNIIQCYFTIHSLEMNYLQQYLLSNNVMN